jgi:hypothetical protein
MTAELPLTGGCGCGAVRFEVTAPLTGAQYCHCTRCQRRTGTAASLSGRVEPGSVTIVSGEEHVREWRPQGGMPKAFCVQCGSALFVRTPDGEIIGVRFGALDADPGVRPSFHQWVSSAAPWEPIPDDGLPRYPERAPA